MKVVFLSIQSSDAKVMENAMDRLRVKQGLHIDSFCINYEEADDDPVKYQELVDRTVEADLVLIRCMSEPFRFKRFEKYEKVLRAADGYVMLFSGNADVTLMYRDLFKGSDRDFVLLRNYASYKGAENDYGIMCWIADRLGLLKSEVPEPVKQRRDGIYHPGRDRDIDVGEYRRSLDPGKPTIGILFTGNLWIYDNMDHIDALIGCLESKGLNTVPVFFTAVSAAVEGEKGTAEVIREYMTDGGQPFVDAIIICTSFSQLTNSRKTAGVGTRDEENYYRHLTNVPIIHAMTVSGQYHDLEDNAVGLGKNDIAMHVAWPEVDGQIIAVPIGHTPGASSGSRRIVPLPDRIEHISELAKNWAILRRTPPEERKVAILLYQNRPDPGNIGGAAGLDSLESVCEVLKRMSELGYKVDSAPCSGKELIVEMLDGVTNDLSNMPLKFLREKAAGLVGVKSYLEHFDRIPSYDKKMMLEQWGSPPGQICVEGKEIVIPGLIKGNVFIGYQPRRGFAEQMEAAYHDPLLFAPHQYLEYYRWIKTVFKAHVVVHVGTHGTLEWLPGKNVGLSGKCDSDIILDALPHVYPYIIDDPGEGIQTKRRSESVVIGHLNPTMARAGTYDELAEVEVPLQEYFKLRHLASKDRKEILVSNIYKAAKEHHLLADLGLREDPGPEGFEVHVGKLHDYITGIKDALIRSDLHVLGRPPAGHHLDEALYSLTRLRNGDIPSFRTAFANNMGFDIEAALENPGIRRDDGVLNSELIDATDKAAQELLAEMRSLDYDVEKSMALLRERYGAVSASLAEAVEFVCGTVAPNLLRTTEEIGNMMDAFNGEYVLPGPSGAPTRGNAHILPMGRNYYGIDPDSVPNPSAWSIGKKMADRMVEKYVSEKGGYPREVGFIIWATDTMKTGGDDVAYILWLLGVRPIWSRSGGQVVDLEVISLSELGRPRIDVTVNITGLFRDTFPNIVDMIDRAVSMVADLDESDEDNCLVANLRRDIVEGIAQGLPPDEARRRAAVRIFGAPPGGYGTGINHAIETGEWRTVQDLADIYIAWCGHGYSRGYYGEDMKDRFIRQFSRVAVTIKNMPDREIDLLDCDDFYSYLGAMNALVKAYGGREAVSVMGDGSNPDKVKVRSAAEELKYVFRSKVLNPKFLDGLKEHGYRGAAELASLTEFAFAWDATSDIMDDWMYEGLAEKFLFDENTRQWMMNENPHAMMSILGRLQEAIERGLWDASDEMRQRLKDLYLDIEERLEEATDKRTV